MKRISIVKRLKNGGTLENVKAIYVIMATKAFEGTIIRKRMIHCHRGNEIHSGENAEAKSYQLESDECILAIGT